MKWDQANKMYFVGIGGIGMSALATYFYSTGISIAGYDRTRTALTDKLSSLGMNIHYEDDIEKIPSQYLDPKTTLIVYTPAIPASHSELQYFKAGDFMVLKRSQLLGALSAKSTCLAVAGTHGKTTTTSILGHLLYEAGVEVTAFLGGISENYDSNLIQNGNAVTVVEADEYDRSFLTLNPDIACITSIDADHLDIYGSEEQLIDSFNMFARQLKSGGKLIVNSNIPIEGISCSIEGNADYNIQNIKIENGSYVFSLKTPDTLIENIRFDLPGRHNLSNALIALAMAIEYGCAPYSLVSALASYKGVKRRFTYEIKTDNLVFIDDYAHHPEEINAVNQAVREMYPGKRILVVFQPHLFSRTRDFGDEFAHSLARFDEILLLEIYPARELPIEGIDSTWLLNKIDHENKKLVSKSEMIHAIRNSKADIIMTLGAGDIGEEVKHIKQSLSVAS